MARLAGLFVASALAAPAAAGLPPNYPSVPIKGIDGKAMPMPLYGLGVWQYNNSLAQQATSLAFSLGYRHVDTALVYENQVGVGAALKGTGLPREQYFVTSKVPGGMNTAAATKAFDQCLTELGLEYVDLMLLHFPADFSGKGGDLRKEQWLALEAWAKSGKARAIGISHYCQRQTEDILAVATVPIAVNQVQYHVGMGSAGALSTDDKPYFESKGILYQSFSPLCGPCDPPHNKELITGELVTSIGAAHNKTGAQVALRWLVQQGIPVIPKSSERKHLQENADIFDFQLTDAEMATLTAATSPAVGGGPSATDSGDCSVPRDDDTLVV